ncbi:MAG: hypothetical protein G01um101493_56 [Microgenomates group bacterium Gr01-1014_93]|nr:MAG: hypothetical protein G01um101493_56 [Microgenomates group bacterium Gr01-1014_93]
MGEEKPLSKTLQRLLLTTAIVLDVLQFGIQAIPVIGQAVASIVGGLAGIYFFLIFKAHGIKFTKPKKAFNLGLGVFIELMPVINAFPGWSFYVWRTIGDNKKLVASKTK